MMPGILNFLQAELPEVFEKVDVQKWVFEPGLPDEWHRPKSHLYNEVQQVLDKYQHGTRPVKEQVQGWHRFQILSCLQGLPKKIPVEKFMAKVGRMLYILPIVRAMIETDWSREHVRPLFERVRERHHQITIHRIEGLLKKAGL